MSEWSKYKFQEIFDISSGLSKNKKDFGFGYPFLSFKDVFYNLFLPENLESLANTTDKERKTCSIRKGDLFLTRTSETQDELGMSSVALKDYEDATFNGFTKRLRIKNKYNHMINSLYLGYYMRSPKMRKQISSLSIMTTRASLNNSMINSLELYIPHINIQNKIGKILYSIDKKIENNRKTAEKLEQIAQAIFKRWFVDFEFPNKEGKPYKSSGGEMVYCDELGKEIPLGWECKKLEQLVSITRGASPRPIKDYIRDSGIPWVKIADATKYNSKYIFETKEFIKEEGKSKSRTVVEGQLILSNSATPGIPRIMQIEACVHDGWLIFRDYKNTTKEYVYYYLLFNRNEILSKSNGSVFRNLKTDILKNSLVAVPPSNVLEMINKRLILIDEKILINQRELRSLQQTRDALLPKLMSGEIKV